LGGIDGPVDAFSIYFKGKWISMKSEDFIEIHFLLGTYVTAPFWSDTDSKIET
jgi:hypothetical protein